MKWINENKKMASVILGTLLCLAFIIYGATAAQSDKILHGVRAGEVNLSGLTRKQGEKAIVEFVKSRKEKKIRLKSDVTSYTYTFDQLGFGSDPKPIVDRAFKIGREGKGIRRMGVAIKLLFVPEDVKLNSNYDKVQMARVIKELEKRVNRHSVNARLDKNDQDEIIHLAGRNGARLNTNKTKEMITSLVGSEDVVSLPVKEIEPQVKKVDLASMNGVLGTFSTDYHKSEENRKHNIALGSEFFNEILLQPGQKVSFLKTIGGIDEKKGFKVSGVIIDGEFDRGIGGGICQVSTTMYNALVRADVEIVQRHNHSRPIGYVPRGTDAAVVDGYKDLVFKNNYKTPIYLVAKADDYDVEFTIYGNLKEKPYDVELVPESLGAIYPGVKKKYSSSLYQGVEKVEKQGAKGYSYQTWKVKRKDGKEIERTLLNKSYYVPKQKVVLIGTKERAVSKSKESESNKSTSDLNSQ